jgi:hypothetical protein
MASYIWAARAGLARPGKGSKARGIGMGFAVGSSAEYEELLAADPVGIVAHHGVEQALVAQARLA